ncbi:hypothetical protein Nocox_05790 [Nonomuraea coxensis DSM 45129]|uniref:Beta-lactamase n=1 Tax=Nonomuraea coxensis DSM 45129 TaxID=1122611 RepID=A0ABX8TTI7_9ACTN|nr:hypothetical protein [Nonomuraea coxensis]QYC38785.1 hypothetical protein Nocox_05790 [Nonomuraea coxensis DSM 45129]
MRTTSKIAIVTSVLVASGAAPVAASAAAAPAFVAYHNVGAAESVKQVRRLKEQGYRPLTVNVSDGERYAAVWVKGGSPDWGIWQGMSASGYQRRVDAGVKEGVQPVSVSATGPAGSAVFTAVFDKKGGTFQSRHNLTGSEFAAANKHAVGQGLALTSVDAYGTPDDVRYVAVWAPNPGGAWYYTYGKSRSQHEAEFHARKDKGFRPVKVAVAPDGTYTAVWRKDGLKSWAHFVDMSASGYQARFDQLKGKGLYPVQVNAEGGKYTAVWE